MICIIAALLHDTKTAMNKITVGEVKDGMNSVKRKLNSQAGASITYALLLFLVCAVLSSVIVVAATAASGRMSKIAESDQRYYAVTSAAEFLKDIIENDTNNVFLVTATTTTKTERFDSDGVLIPDPEPAPDSGTTIVYLVNKPKSKGSLQKDDLKDSGYCAVATSATPKTITMDAAKYIGTGAAGNNSKRLLIQSSSGRTELRVTVDETMAPNGKIILDVYNADGAPFKQELVFLMDTTPSSLPKDEVFKENDDDSEGTLIKIKMTEITTYSVKKLKWSLSSIETKRA